MLLSQNIASAVFNGKRCYEGFYNGRHFRLTDVDKVEAVDFIVVTLPNIERYHDSDTWDDDDTITPVVFDSDNTNVAIAAMSYGGGQYVSPPFNHETASQRCKITLQPGTSGTLRIEYLHSKGWRFQANDTPEELFFSGKRISKEYFRRPEGEGKWQLLLPNAAVPLQVRIGRFWYDITDEGIGPEYAGYQVRPKVPPESHCLARWKNEYGISEFFFYCV